MTNVQLQPPGVQVQQHTHTHTLIQGTQVQQQQHTHTHLFKVQALSNKHRGRAIKKQEKSSSAQPLNYCLFSLSFEDWLGLEDLLGCELMLVDVTIFLLLPWI